MANGLARRAAQIAALLLLAAIGLLVLGWLWLRFWLDPNDLKPWLANEARARYGRELVIAGDLKWVLLPAIALEAQQVSLSEAASAERFADAKSLRFGLALWPLLERRLLIDSIEVEGLALALRRDGAGTWNFANLLPTGPATLREWRIERLVLRDAKLMLDLGAGQPGLMLEKISASASPLTPNSSGRFDFAGDWDYAGSRGQLRLASGYALLQADEPLALTQLKAELATAVSGGNLGIELEFAKASLKTGRVETLSLAAKLASTGHAAELTLTAPAVRLFDNPLATPIASQWRYASGETRAEGSLTGVVEQVNTKQWRVGALRVVARASMGKTAATLELEGEARARPNQFEVKASQLRLLPPIANAELMGSANFLLSRTGGNAPWQAEAELAGRLDSADLTASWAYPGAQAGQHQINAHVDRLDLDRLQPAPTSTRSPPAAAKPGAGLNDWLQPLRALPVAGVITIGTLNQSGVEARDVRIAFE